MPRQHVVRASSFAVPRAPNAGLVAMLAGVLFFSRLYQSHGGVEMMDGTDDGGRVKVLVLSSSQSWSESIAESMCSFDYTAPQIIAWSKSSETFFS